MWTKKNMKYGSDTNILIPKEKLSIKLLSAYQEKIPARNAIYAHAQDFEASNELLLSILKAFITQPLNKQRTIGLHVFWWIQCNSM
jgi:hypothetical protein